MERIKLVLKRKFGPLTGLQWLLVAAVVGGILFVLYRRRLEEEEEAIASGEAGPLEEGGAGTDFRGDSSALPFVGGAVGYTEPPPAAPFEGLTAEEQIGWFEQIIGGIEELLNPPIEEEPPIEEPPPEEPPPDEPGPVPHETPEWKKRIQGLRARNARARRRIHRMRRGGVTPAERKRIQRRRQQIRRRRRRIGNIRKRHASQVGIR